MRRWPAFSGFPERQRRPRVDDPRVPIIIASINRNGLRGCDAPRDYNPRKTLDNRWKRKSRMGCSPEILHGLASEAADVKTIMINAT